MGGPFLGNCPWANRPVTLWTCRFEKEMCMRILIHFYPAVKAKLEKILFVSIYITLKSEIMKHIIYATSSQRSLRLGFAIPSPGIPDDFRWNLDPGNLNNFPGIPKIFYIYSKFLKIWFVAVIMDLCGSKYSSHHIEFNRCYLCILPPQIQIKYFNDSLVQFSRQIPAPVKVKK